MTWFDTQLPTEFPPSVVPHSGTIYPCGAGHSLPMLERSNHCTVEDFGYSFPTLEITTSDLRPFWMHVGARPGTYSVTGLASLQTMLR